MSRAGTITRRTLLVAAVAVAGGVAFGYYAYRKPYPNPLEAGLEAGEAAFNPYVTIGSDDTVTIIVPRAEMGQGVETTLAALVAEELDVALERVRIEHGPASPAYANIAMLKEGVPFPQFDESWLAELARDGIAVFGKFLGLQATGGSSSTVDAFVKMRRAGAAARETLKAAAGKTLNVAASSLQTADGRVTDPATGRSVSYGEVAQAAARLDPPAEPALKPREAWRLLGTALPRTDMRAKVTGAPIYGVDVALPDMLHATVRMNPHLGAPMRGMDAQAAEAMPGVVKVVPIAHRLGHGFAVVARSTWHAFRGADAVEADWAPATYPADDDGLWAAIEAAADESGFSLRDDGDVDVAFADAPRERLVEAEYRAPWLAHACMEPMNATARLADGRLEVWAPNQVPTLVQKLCAEAVGLPAEACTVHTTYLGGGFGRRLETDYAVYAALVAAETDGRPVKVTWTREEDTTHDAYRPAAYGRLRARLGDDGLPAAIDMKIASPSIMASMVPRIFPGVPLAGPDRSLVDGTFNQPYAVPDYRVEGVPVPLDLPVGYWRSVGYSYNAFFHECFLDEIAAAGGHDPVALRRRLMQPWPTAVNVVDTLAAMSGWQTPPGDGRARGIAFSACFGSWSGAVVEVAEGERGVRIERVWLAADVGTALDPRNIEAQLVSGAVFGLSAATGQEITFAEGRVAQSNFHDYDAMRIHQCPRFEVAVLETAPEMGGVGEIGTPPAIAALVNAVSALTGERLRRLPLSHAVTFA
ncbi:molybdopterin-dependent oxidoreductase [Aquibium sp. A9E412]|uniref:xanthine dehydrogenase family protein molybdopterin-binding subunit n=1 Tax=Aquibium sp. A9E412 TaxID=2976767 RepID=UPI0025AF2F8A|nr:molybdopterin cofactor-binding domain-containing protein [Aquibium sp. A9E412]MDN2566998.1 molybdopterin-dependent oxidoreductase [Aquibium sp. A9E412]